MQAQTKPVGEYQLRGVREMASGFKLNEDSTFQFYFSYGALDRFGEGRWTMKGNSLILNSRQSPGLIFLWLVQNAKAMIRSR